MNDVRRFLKRSLGHDNVVQVHVGSPTLICLRGEIDLAGRASLEAALAEVMATEASDVDVELGAVTFFSSEGLWFLAMLNERAVATGHRLTVWNPCPVVRRVFALTGFDRILSVADWVQPQAS